MSRDYFWLTDRQFARIAPHLPTDTPLLTSVVQSARSSCLRRMALTGCREALVCGFGQFSRYGLTCGVVMEIDRRRRDDRRAELALEDHPNQHPLTHCPDPPAS